MAWVTARGGSIGIQAQPLSCATNVVTIATIGVLAPLRGDQLPIVAEQPVQEPPGTDSAISPRNEAPRKQPCSVRCLNCTWQ
jgi:hypothetical protein